MPIDLKLYPKNWKQISTMVRDRAGQKCELCGAPNKTYVVRFNTGRVSPLWRIAKDSDIFGSENGLVKIVLTVHHIDGNRQNNGKHNLIALCQRCHLRLDREKHIRKRMAGAVDGHQMEVAL